MKIAATLAILLNFLAGSGQASRIYVSGKEKEVVRTAAGMLSSDFETVLDSELEIVSSGAARADIIVRTRPRRFAAGSREAFTLKVQGRKLKIFGSDPRGTAYGIMEVSRRLGVSPWVYWADAVPGKMESFSLPKGFRYSDAPVVAYRGIFINDEDWGFMPWGSTGHGRPVGEIGPEAYGKVFELLLRLRANTFWPAMHECSKAFYTVEGNREAADRYGIIISTSHCEPMMRNANGEWREWASDPSGRGYNFIENKEKVLEFWRERVRELKGSDCIYTLGMRGIHDGQMFGTRTAGDQLAALKEVLKEQRLMLGTEIGDVEKIPQQFIPYKEVLDAYNAGLEVPDDATLIWCDDNYGYIRHFPTPEERARKGGNGIYYHVSYWGRPHDYLWLSTTHPELIRSEMMRGYDYGIDRIWIVNVGDIKPAEFDISLFLDMAWSPESFRDEESVWDYCDRWYREQTGVETDWKKLWKAYYDLAFDFRPEWLGGTRVEEADRNWMNVRDLPLNETQADSRLAACSEMERMLSSTGVDLHDPAFFQLVTYPVRCQNLQNIKWLNAQKARHGLSGWGPSHDAYAGILSLTEEYNTLLDGKWELMMTSSPRSLRDYGDPEEVRIPSPMPEGQGGKEIFRSPSAIGTPLKDGLTLEFENLAPEIQVEVQVLPVHPTVDGSGISYTVSLDGGQDTEVDFHTEGRSEEWKTNVLYNKSVRTVSYGNVAAGRHSLTLRSGDENVRLKSVYLK